MAKLKSSSTISGVGEEFAECTPKWGSTLLIVMKGLNKEELLILHLKNLFDAEKIPKEPIFFLQLPCRKNPQDLFIRGLLEDAVKTTDCFKIRGSRKADCLIHFLRDFLQSIGRGDRD